MNSKKKRSALEISNEIGLHGEFRDYTKVLEDEIDRLQKGIITAMETTHDDDTYELLGRLIKDEESDD